MANAMRTKQLSLMSSGPSYGVEILRADEGKQELITGEEHRLAGAKTPYSYYFARKPTWQSPGKGTSVVLSTPKESQPRLRKRRTTEDVVSAATARATTRTNTTIVTPTTTTNPAALRLRQQKETPTPRPSTYIDVTANMRQQSNESERIRRPLAKSAASMSTTNILLPNLDQNSLWLNRKAQAKPPQEHVMSAVPTRMSSLPEHRPRPRADLGRQTSAASSSTSAARPLPPIPKSRPPLPPIPRVSPPQPPVTTAIGIGSGTAAGAAGSKPYIPPLLITKKSTRKSKRFSSMSKSNSIYPHHNPDHFNNNQHNKENIKDTLTIPASFSRRSSKRRSRARPRPLSVATTMSMYSQRSFPHHLQLPSPTHSYAHSEGLQWFVGGESSDSDGDFESEDDKVQLEHELRERCADDYYGYGYRHDSSFYSALGPRTAERPLSALSMSDRRSIGTARSGAISRARSYASIDTVRKSPPPRPPTRIRRRQRQRPWSGSLSVMSASTAASLPAWTKYDITQVQEEMRSFLDMSEDARWSADVADAGIGIEVEQPMEGEGKMDVDVEMEMEKREPSEMPGSDPGSSLTSSSRSNSYSSSKSTNTTNTTASSRQRSAYRGSTILPRTRSPSPNPTMSYVIVIGHEEEQGPLSAGTTVVPKSASSTTTVIPNSTSTEGEGRNSAAYEYSHAHSSSMTSYLYQHSYPHSRLHSGVGMGVNGREGSVLCGDYDYGFAVDVLVHDPECDKGRVGKLLEEDEDELDKEHRNPGSQPLSRAQKREEFVYHGPEGVMQPMAMRRVIKKPSARSSLRKHYVGAGGIASSNLKGGSSAGQRKKKRKLCVSSSSKRRGSGEWSIRDGRRYSGEMKRNGRKKEKERRSLFVQVVNFFGRRSSIRDSGMR